MTNAKSSCICLRISRSQHLFEMIQKSKFEYLDRRITRLHEESFAALMDANRKLDRLLATAMLDEEAKGGAYVGAMSQADQQDLQDRKRLKERLKEAAAAVSGSAENDGSEANGGGAAASMLERVFGIRKGDLRAGKERSRYAIYVLSPDSKGKPGGKYESWIE
jgi:hypothetical protein